MPQVNDCPKVKAREYEATPEVLHNLTKSTASNAILIARANSSGAFSSPPEERTSFFSKLIARVVRPLNVD